MMRAPLLALLVTLLPVPLAAQPPRLANAKVTARTVAPSGLAREMKDLAAAASDVRWAGWSVPTAERDADICCYGSVKVHGRSNRCCGGCTLEGDHQFTNHETAKAGVQRLDGPALVNVLVRFSGRSVSDVRVYSDDCALDAGGRVVTWLDGVVPAESVAYVESLVAGEARGSGRDFDDDLADHALLALAMHDGQAADEALGRFLARANPLELRKKAAFWLGNSRGRRGYEMLKPFANDPDAELREHLTFAFSQNGTPEALDLLRTMARRDPDSEVRGKALFWMAQKAGEKAAEAIEDAIANDPDEDVKVKAVFALTQLPKHQGVPHLIRVAKTNRNAEVRKRAVFWLGQSKDPRALDFVEELLVGDQARGR